MVYKFTFIFIGRDHEFLVKSLPLLTRYQVLLQEENSTDPRVLKESLPDPQDPEVFYSLPLWYLTALGYMTSAHWPALLSPWKGQNHKD